MAALGPLLILGSTAMSAVGAIQSSNAESATAEANAKQLEQRATAERAMASVNAERSRKEADRLISKQRAIAAASGGGTGGSAGLLMAESAGQGQLNSDMDIWLGEEKAVGNEYAATMARAEAKAKRKALPFQVGAAVLSGVSQAYSQAPASWKGGGGAGGWKTTVEPSYRYG